MTPIAIAGIALVLYLLVGIVFVAYHTINDVATRRFDSYEFDCFLDRFEKRGMSRRTVMTWALILSIVTWPTFILPDKEDPFG